MNKIFRISIIILLIFCSITNFTYAKEKGLTKKEVKSSAKEERLSEKEADFQGKLGIGIQLGAMNEELGPTLKYYLTNNLALQAKADLAWWGIFKTYGIRGIYQFNKWRDIADKVDIYPYAGLGYMMVKGPEETWTYYYCTGKYQTEGSGAELLGGVLFDLKKATGVNLHAAAEAIYSPIEVKTTYEMRCGRYYGGKLEYKSDWSEFIIGGSLIYYFK